MKDVNAEFMDELHKWAEKDGTNHRLATLLQNTALQLAIMQEALHRQCSNMSFVLNRVELPDPWRDKFEREYVEDWKLAGVEAGRPSPQHTETEVGK